MNYLSEALRLAELGWKVFALGQTGMPLSTCRPCKTTCLTPEAYEACEHLHCHATYAATTEPEIIREMWDSRPEALIGIRTGEASGILVVDVDRHGPHKDGWEAFKHLRDSGDLPPTVVAQTGRRGLHLYYRNPAENVKNDNRGKLAKGLDIKSNGGYVIAPPSQKRDGMPYSWIQGRSPWDHEIASLPLDVMMRIADSGKKTHTTHQQMVTESDPVMVTFRYQCALDLINHISEGSRNDRFFQAACRAGEAVACGALTHEAVAEELTDAGLRAGLSLNEINKSLRSGLLRGANDFGSSV